MAEPTNPRLQGISPFMIVADIVASAEYYRDRLGFRFDDYWGDPPRLVILYRDGVQIMLAAGNADTPPNPNRTADGYCWQAYVYVDDADAVFAEIEAAGADILRPPEDRFYGLRDFDVMDPDGYVLSFGHELK